MTEKYVLAQVNIARALAPMDDAIMQDFANGLEEINQLAENTPGFVWRLQDESGDATSIHVYEDNMLLINMSVWEDADSLFQYTYYSDHVKFFRRRGEWFENLERPHMVLWWVKANEMPTPYDAKDRLAYFTEHGATPHAFTFKKRFSIEEMLQYLSETT